MYIDSDPVLLLIVSLVESKLSESSWSVWGTREKSAAEIMVLGRGCLKAERSPTYMDTLAALP